MILIFLASGGVLLNALPVAVCDDCSDLDYGWPWAGYRVAEWQHGVVVSTFHIAGIVKDVVFCGAVLGVAAFVSEKYLRSLIESLRALKDRRWFRIHLSTAIATMLTAAVLLRANISPTVVRGPTFEDRNYGWPQECYWFGKATPEISVTGPDEDSLWRTSALVIDAVVAFGILGAVTLTCEVIARRSNAKDQTT